MCSVFLMRDSGCLTVLLTHGAGVQWKSADSYKTNVIPNLESNFCSLSVELLQSAKSLLSEP